MLIASAANNHLMMASGAAPTVAAAAVLAALLIPNQFPDNRANNDQQHAAYNPCCHKAYLLCLRFRQAFALTRRVR